MYVCIYLSIICLFIYLPINLSSIFGSIFGSPHPSVISLGLGFFPEVFDHIPCLSVHPTHLCLSEFHDRIPPAISQEESYSPLQYMLSEFSAQGHDAPKTTEGRTLHNQAMDLKPGRNLLQKFFARIPL